MNSRVRKGSYFAHLRMENTIPLIFSLEMSSASLYHRPGSAQNHGLVKCVFKGCPHRAAAAALKFWRLGWSVTMHSNGTPRRCRLTLGVFIPLQPAGRTLTSDSSLNSFIMIVNQKNIFVVVWTEQNLERKK